MDNYKKLAADASAGKKKFAVLLDPDKCPQNFLTEVIKLSIKSDVDYFFIGGSLLMNDNQCKVIRLIKENSTIPVLLFPGNNLQLNNQADGILLLSLISGRNPDMLIGRHVISAPFLKASALEIISTGYMLIDSGSMTTVMYMSNTTPIPSDKSEIAVCTALAGEMLGMKLIYMDAGSGSKNPVPVAMIRAVKEAVKIPLIVGGGIVSAELAKQAITAGADVVVVGNAIERNPGLIPEIAAMR
ncbi:MAG: geranylgeranylglyceryl/heptaprenylglyceryl phosphate synthase [Bacteroidota bacterium]